MLLKKIVLRNREKFEQVVEDWSKRMKIDVEVFDGKESLLDTIDSVVVIHEDFNISKENKELRELLERNNKIAHQVDINATMNASVSSLRFWLDNNKPKSVLFVGDEKLTKSARLETYFEKLAENLAAN
jgi:nitrogen-specific signal transduction histidine kinase